MQTGLGSHVNIRNVSKGVEFLPLCRLFFSSVFFIVIWKRNFWIIRLSEIIYSFLGWVPGTRNNLGDSKSKRQNVWSNDSAVWGNWIEKHLSLTKLPIIFFTVCVSKNIVATWIQIESCLPWQLKSKFPLQSRRCKIEMEELYFAINQAFFHLFPFIFCCVWLLKAFKLH